MELATKSPATTEYSSSTIMVKNTCMLSDSPTSRSTRELMKVRQKRMIAAARS